jgi:hypothetical protein
VIRDRAIALVAEDDLSLAVVERAVSSSGRHFEVVRRFVERGFGNIKRSVVKYRQASHVIPHVVLTDLDQEACPAMLRKKWGAVDLPDTVLFCVAVRETESWLLADRSGFAKFAGVASAKMPAAPEDLPDPKAMLMSLVRRSRNRRLATELLPAQGSAARIGPLYNQRLGQFVRTDWDLDVAARVCPSLQRMRDRLAKFLE